VSCFRVLAAGLLLFATPAHSSPDHDRAPASNDATCRYSVAYTAPATCPDATALEQRLGPSYHVERGTMNDCEACVRGIEIDAVTAQSSYRMRLAGLESTAVERAQCDELIDLAVYAIEASDLPTPECSAITGRLGLSTSPFVNVANVDHMFFTALRATLPLDSWQLTGFGLWLVPTDAPSQAPRTNITEVHFSGFGAGLEVCRDAFLAAQFCGAGMWRRVEGYAVGGEWGAAKAAHIWTLGGGLSWTLPLTTSLRFEVEPTVMAVLNGANLTAEAVGEPLYSHAGVEALLRVGFSWEFGASDTPVNTEALRAAATPTSSQSAKASSNGIRWF
jgi:hypothetical protein